MATITTELEQKDYDKNLKLLETLGVEKFK
jgi:hypothetical protein